MQALPDSVQMIADVIGVDAALHLIDNLPRYAVQSTANPSGKLILYVPKSLALNHRLVAVLGYQDALKLVRAFGGEILYPAAVCKQVARVDRDDAIVRFAARGMRKIEIATMLQVDPKTVGRIIERHALQVPAARG